MKLLITFLLVVAVALAAPLNFITPYAVHPSAAVVYAAPAVHHVAYAAPIHHVAYAAPAVQTHVHYADTPVVVGSATQILKPNLGAVGVVSKTGEIVQKEKVLAPVRTVSDVTPQVTVQHPTQVNVQRVAVDVPVASPYAHPVPFAVSAPYEIHQYHSPALTLVA